MIHEALSSERQGISELHLGFLVSSDPIIALTVLGSQIPGIKTEAVFHIGNDASGFFGEHIPLVKVDNRGVLDEERLAAGIEDFRVNLLVCINPTAQPGQQVEEVLPHGVLIVQNHIPDLPERKIGLKAAEVYTLSQAGKNPTPIATGAFNPQLDRTSAEYEVDKRIKTGLGVASILEDIAIGRIHLNH